jgi:hypothetical protein
MQKRSFFVVEKFPEEWYNFHPLVSCPSSHAAAAFGRKKDDFMVSRAEKTSRSSIYSALVQRGHGPTPYRHCHREGMRLKQ